MDRESNSRRSSVILATDVAGIANRALLVGEIVHSDNG